MHPRAPARPRALPQITGLKACFTEFDADGSGTPGDDSDLVMVIQNGAMKFGGSPLMAPWPTLTEVQVTDIIAHIRSLKAADGAAGEAAAPADAPP